VVNRKVFTFSICHFPFNAKWKMANVKWAMLAVPDSSTTHPSTTPPLTIPNPPAYPARLEKIAFKPKSSQI